MQMEIEAEYITIKDVLTILKISRTPLLKNKDCLKP